jgi:hypothetical protein
LKEKEERMKMTKKEKEGDMKKDEINTLAYYEKA